MVARGAVTTILLAGVVAAAGLSPAGAVGKTGLSSQLAPLPSNASSSVIDAQLNSVACTSVGNCVAVGRYQGSTVGAALIVTEHDGQWGGAQTIAMPKNAEKGADGVLNSVACTSVGNCVAVGAYQSTKSTGAPTFDIVNEPLVVTETNGKWHGGLEAPQPPNSALGEVTALNGVSCPKAGWCMAVGQFITHAGNQAWTVGYLNGKWKGARAVGLVSSAKSNFITQLDSISCVAVGFCMAVGQFVTTAPARVALVVELAHNIWHLGDSVVLPQTVRNPWAGLFSIKCFAWGTCVTVGVVTSGPSRQGQGLIEVQYKGKWQRGILAPHPTNPLNDAIADQLLGISCTGYGNCDAVGQYTSGSVTQAISIVETKGHWGLASIAPRPTGWIKPTYADLAGVSCRSKAKKTSCVMVGQYQTIVGDPALIVSHS